MEEKSIFESLNLEEFFNSENPTVDITDVTKEDPKPKEVKDNKKDEGIDTPKSPFESMTPEEIAEYEPEAEEDDNEDSGDNKIKAPVKKDNTPSSTPLSSFAKSLFETGVLSSLTEEEIEAIGDEEALMEAVAKQIKSNEKADLNEKQLEYLEALRNGVPHETFAQKSSNAAVYEAITEDQLSENQNLRVELIRRKFISNGFSDKEALKYAGLSVQAGTDLEDATEAKTFLANKEKETLRAEIEKNKLAKIEKEKTEAEKLSALKSKINQSEKIIENLNFNSVTKEKIYNSITKPSKTINNEPVNEVMALYLEDEAYKIRLHALHEVTKGFTDFSKFLNTKKTEAVKDLKKTIESTTIVGNNGKTIKSGGGSTSSNLIDAIDSFLK